MHTTVWLDVVPDRKLELPHVFSAGATAVMSDQKGDRYAEGRLWKGNRAW